MDATELSAIVGAIAGVVGYASRKIQDSLSNNPKGVDSHMAAIVQLRKTVEQSSRRRDEQDKEMIHTLKSVAEDLRQMQRDQARLLDRMLELVSQYMQR